jgi:hypothetical protein
LTNSEHAGTLSSSSSGEVGLLAAVLELQAGPSVDPYGSPAKDSIPSLNEILTADPDRFVAKYTDIAAVNLACAVGLAKTDDHNFAGYLALLDKMAEAVRVKTEKSWRLFKLKPTEFHNSENVFRVFTMEHVLRMQFGVKYDPLVQESTKGGKPRDKGDSTEMFIHGVLSAKRTGTCSSLPTFSIAIGRRLGYPLKLVRVPIHTFFRWDDGKETFNHQHTDTGGVILPDEHFHTWPRQWDADDFAMNGRTKVWLHSMTPKQEVSKFLCNRAIFLRDTGRFQEGLDALEAAERFDPANPACADIYLNIQDKMPRAKCEVPSLVAISTPRPGFIPMPIEPEPDQLLDTLNPFRDRAKDPRHLTIRISRVRQQPAEEPQHSLAKHRNGRSNVNDCRASRNP